uniref:Pentacotripeptide-repeat region of PRORP domain-containing protein n=1 Tax=Pyrodinium bahamense TaxID=73915 RepID=A0A7S0AE77_9DINO
MSGAALDLCAKARWWQRAWKVWSAMPTEWRSVVHYSTMIDLCARCQRVREAESLFAEMGNAAVEPNIITHNNLIKALSTAGQPERASQAFQAVPRALLAGAGLRTQRSTYQVVMIAWARVGNYAKAREVFMEMSQAGIAPDLPHYNALLVACAAAGDGAIADGIFVSLLSAGLKPDVTIYTICISCHRHNLARCWELMGEMQQARLQPSAMTYVELLEAHVLAGDGAGARELLGAPELRAVPPRSAKLRRLVAQTRALPLAPSGRGGTGGERAAAAAGDPWASPAPAPTAV